MLKRKIKWSLLFQDKQELDNLFQLKECVVHKSFVGEFLLVKQGEDYYAFKNKCPHQNKPLEGSRVEGEHLICPWHQYHFSLEDGRGHGLYVEKYPLKFEDEGIYIGQEKWSLF